MPLLYNRAAAVSYAHQWAFARNPAYLNFQGIGGDCTNFVSQCLKAGGAPQNYTRDIGWYYTSATNRAAAWTSVEHLHRFLLRRHTVGPKGTAVPINQIQPGDIIQLAFIPPVFSHSLFVVSTEGTPSPQTVKVATHSFDADNRLLSSYSYLAYRCIHIEI